MAKTTLLLIRHGESAGNRTNTFTGFEDAPLTEIGVKQAELLRDYLINSDIDKVVSSDLSRAYLTALPLADAKGMEVEKHYNLREINGGKWGGMEFAKIKDIYPEDFNVWVTDFANAVCTGGESVRELADRVYKEICDIVDANRGKTVAVVIHGTPLRTLFCRWMGYSLDDLDNVPWASNASVSTAVFEDDSLTPEITEFNSTTHLEGLVTSLPRGI